MPFKSPRNTRICTLGVPKGTIEVPRLPLRYPHIWGCDLGTSVDSKKIGLIWLSLKKIDSDAAITKCNNIVAICCIYAASGSASSPVYIKYSRVYIEYISGRPIRIRWIFSDIIKTHMSEVFVTHRACGLI